MHQPPSAADLLRTVQETLDADIVPALSGPSQHQARVAASIVAIVARELELGPDVRDHELDLLQAIIGTEVDPDDRARVAAEWLRSGGADESDEHDRVLALLTDIARGDLSIAKPGYDAWDGD